MVHWSEEELYAWQRQILRLEGEGKLTRTFRRLDPDRQRMVVEAILADAAEYGPSAIHVKRVAARAGLAVGSLYRYFPHREGMLDVAASIAAGFLTESLDAFVPQMGQMPLREGLLVYLSSGVEWSVSSAGLFTFFVRAAYQGAPGFGESLVAPVARSMLALLRALLDGARDRGELRPDLDFDVAARLVLTLTTAVADAELLPHLNNYYLLYDATRPPEQVREAVVDFVVRAIGREAGAAGRDGDGTGAEARRKRSSAVRSKRA